MISSWSLDALLKQSARTTTAPDARRSGIESHLVDSVRTPQVRRGRDLELRGDIDLPAASLRDGTTMIRARSCHG